MNRVGKIITTRCFVATNSGKKKTDVPFGILISRTNMIGQVVSSGAYFISIDIASDQYYVSLCNTLFLNDKKFKRFILQTITEPEFSKTGNI